MQAWNVGVPAGDVKGTRSPERVPPGHILVAGTGDELERVLLHDGVVAQSEWELEGLLQALEQSRFVFENVEGDLGVYAQYQGALLIVGAGPTHCALDAAHDGLGRKDPARPSATGAGLRL